MSDNSGDVFVEDRTIIEGESSDTKKKTNISSGSQTSAIYGMGMIGALIYYISTATTFWMGVVGVLKAIVWPVILVYEALSFFGA